MAITLHEVTLSPLARAAAPLADILARLAGPLGRRMVILRRWRDRTEAVRQLTRLDERMLKDIGLSRHDLAPLIEAWQAHGEPPLRRPQPWSD